jgi:hypothetical protein
METVAGLIGLLVSRQPVNAAVTALKPRESARQVPAPEELPKGALNERRQAVGVAQSARLGQERLEVILHDPVKHAAGGTTRFVARGRPGHPAHEAEAVPTSHSHPISATARGFPSSDLPFVRRGRCARIADFAIARGVPSVTSQAPAAPPESARSCERTVPAAALSSALAYRHAVARFDRLSGPRCEQFFCRVTAATE